jgi:hypothetical protein
VPTVSHTIVVGAAPAQYFFEHASFSVPPFDTTLGELVSIDVTGSVFDLTQYGVEFTCAEAGRNSTTFTNHSYTDLVIAGTTYSCGSGGESKTLSGHSPFDGVIDLAGTSGQTVNSSYTYTLGLPAGPITDGTALRMFSGTATVPIGLVLHKTSSYGQNLGPCGQSLAFHVSRENQYTYTLTVTYTYQ